MEVTTKIDRFGRVLIPKTLREMLNLNVGEELSLKLDFANKGLLISPVPPPVDAVQFTDWGWPVYINPSSPAHDYDPAELVQKDREEADNARSSRS